MSGRTRYAIGAGAGFAGDRIEPAVDMARSGALDAIALDPRAYITLDAVLDFSGVEFEPIGPNRIRMSGARAPSRRGMGARDTPRKHFAERVAARC